MSSLDELLKQIEAEGCQNASQVTMLKKCIDVTGNAEKHSCKLIPLLLNAIKHKESDFDEEITSEALVILGECLNQDAFCQSLCQDRCVEVLNALCQLMSQSSNKTIVVRSIWCCSLQKFDSTLLAVNIETILNALNSVVTRLTPSGTIDYEVLNVLEYLSCVAPNRMDEHAALWWNLVVPKVVHHSVKVRTLASKVLQLSHKYLQGNRDVMKNVVFELKNNVINGMISKYNQFGEKQIVELWTIIIELTGKILHCGSSLINSFLEIIERAFKSKTEKIRNEAIIAWRKLIDNFALDLDVISNPKRLRLLLQPLKSTSLKSKEGITDKVFTWWHLIVSLHSNLQHHFEMIVVPLIEYCFGIPKDSALRPGIQAKLDTTTDDENRSLLLDFGIQILVLLYKENRERETNIDFAPLKVPACLNCVMFASQSEIVMKSLVIACRSLEDVKPRKRSLLHLWKFVVSNIREAGDDKRTVALKLSTSLLHSIEQILTNPITDVTFALDLLEIGTTLPESILMSSVISLGSNVLDGTPCIYLLNLLLKGPILNDKNCKKLIPLFKKLVSIEIKTSINALTLVQATIQCIESTMSIIRDPCVALSLWQITASQLIDYIGWSHDVNQGDNLEHDFSCVYVTLMLPIKHLIWMNIPLTVKRSIPKTWSSLYETFARNVSVIRTADDNIYCIELASKITTFIETKQIENDQLDDLFDFFGEMTRMVQWKNLNYMCCDDNSPSKKSTRKSRNASTLNPLFQLFTALVKVFMTPMENKEQFKYSHDHLVVPESIAIKILNQLLFIFDNLKNEAYINLLIHWASFISLFYSFSNETDHVLSTPKITAKLDEVWSKLSTGIKANRKGAYNTFFLDSLSPLLEATLSHRSQPIHSYSRKLWLSTFAATYEKLTIPPSLTEVMNEMEPSMLAETTDDVWTVDTVESRNSASRKSNGSVKITLRNLSHVNTSKKPSPPIDRTPNKRKAQLLDKCLKVVISPDSTPLFHHLGFKATETTNDQIQNETQMLQNFPEVDDAVAANIEVTNDDTQEKPEHVPELINLSSSSPSDVGSEGLEVQQLQCEVETRSSNKKTKTLSSPSSPKTCKRQLRFQLSSRESVSIDVHDVIETNVASYVEIEETTTTTTQELLDEMGVASLNDRVQDKSPVKRSLDSSERNGERLDNVIQNDDPVARNESSETNINNDWNSTSDSTNITEGSLMVNSSCSVPNVAGLEYGDHLATHRSSNGSISNENNERSMKSSAKKTHKKKRKHKSKGSVKRKSNGLSLDDLRTQTDASCSSKPKKCKRKKAAKLSSVPKKSKKKLKKSIRSFVSLEKETETSDDTSSESIPMTETYERRDDSILVASSDSVSTEANTANEIEDSCQNVITEERTSEFSDPVHRCEENDRSSLLPVVSAPENTSVSIEANGTSIPMVETNVLESPKSRVSGLLSSLLSSSEESPRSGILKKRKLEAALSPLSPSSLKKQRRVSFADPPVQNETTNERTIGRERKKIDRQLLPTLNESSFELSSENSPGNYFSPVTTEVNCVDPICPELINCDVSVDVILHRITSSTWFEMSEVRTLSKTLAKHIRSLFAEKLGCVTLRSSSKTRGLSKLLISKNIRTIGHLSSLTEVDIMKLPLKTPKIKLVTEALQHIMKSNGQPPTVSNETSTVSESIAVSDDEPNTGTRSDHPSAAQTTEETDAVKSPLIDLSTDDDSSAMAGVEGLFQTVDGFFDKFVKDDIGRLNHQQVAAICQRFFGYVNKVSRGWIDSRTRMVGNKSD